MVLRARWVTPKSSLGDAKSSLGDAKSSLGDLYAQLRHEQYTTVYDTSHLSAGSSQSFSALPRSSVTCPLYTRDGTTASLVRAAGFPFKAHQ